MAEYVNPDEQELDTEMEGGEGEGVEPTPYLRDLMEDDVYDRLQRMGEVPDTLRAMEDRLTGTGRDLASRLAKLEKGLPTQPVLNIEAITKGLEGYDPKLAETLGPLLQEALQVTPVGEETLKPFLDQLREDVMEQVGRQLVMSAYSPKALEEIIPQVEEGRFSPQGQRQKDFVSWYEKQGYETQQALQSFGPGYVQALRAFEAHEKKLTQDRADAAAGKAGRLKEGTQPSSQDRRAPAPKQKTPEELFLEGIAEVQAERKRA